jgi:hypothetical protein
MHPNFSSVNLNRPFGRPRRRWEEHIIKDLRKKVWEVVEWIHLAQDMDKWRAVVKTILNFWGPEKARKFLTS